MSAADPVFRIVVQYETSRELAPTKGREPRGAPAESAPRALMLRGIANAPRHLLASVKFHLNACDQSEDDIDTSRASLAVDCTLNKMLAEHMFRRRRSCRQRFS